MSADKKAPSWAKMQEWFVGKGTAGDGLAQSPSSINGKESSVGPETPPEPITGQRSTYQTFLENASRTMIRFKKPEHLIKMIVKTIDEQLRVTHTAVLLYKENKKSYVLIDSKGVGWVKNPYRIREISGRQSTHKHIQPETELLYIRDGNTQVRGSDHFSQE